MPNIPSTHPVKCANSWFVSLLLLVAGICPVSAYEVSVQVDSNPAGGAEIASDHVYSIKDDECLIRWHAIQYKNDKRPVLTVYRQCNKSFAEQVDYHEDILARINKDIPITRFQSMSWGRFSFEQDFSWIMPIVLASARSKTYLDYRQNYPYANVNDINQIFVELANETRAYQPLAELFSDFELTLVLQSVEKVFTSKAGKLAFYDDIRDDKYVGKHTRVIYDVGSSYFALIPISQH